MIENWIHYWSCHECGRTFPDNEPGAAIGRDISSCSNFICLAKFYRKTLADWRQFRVTKKYHSIFGCDPDLDREKEIVACSHIWNAKEGVIDVIQNGKVITNYQL